MDEDQILQSIIADPQLTDPNIDVGQLRQTTPTRTELLANVPEFSGLKFDPTQRSYIEDLYSVYGGGLPTIPEPVVEDTAQIPGAVDTLVDVGGGSGMDQVTSGSVLDTPTGGGFTESGTFGGQPTFTTTPGTTVDNVTGDITNPDGSYGGNIVDEVALTGGTTTPVDTSIAIEDLTQPSNIEDFQITTASPLTNQTQITDPVTPIQDLPMVTTSINPATGEVFDAQTEEEIGNLYDEVALTGTATPEQQQGFLQNVLGRAGQTVDNALTELGKVPGAVVDFANQTVDVFGQKLNVGKTLLGAGINKIVGGPVSLIFDLLPSEDPADTLNRSIVDELKAEKNYGFNMQSGNLNQDPFGRNPVSLFGNYEQILLDDATSTGTTKMDLAKKEFAQDYFDKKAGKTAPQEDIESVSGGEGVLDETSSAEDIAQDFASKQAEAELRGENIVY